MDRFGRSLRDLIENIQALDAVGTRFCAPNQGIDTDNRSPTGRLLLHIMGAFAEFERSLIMERVSAGIRQHRTNLRLGRLGKDLHTRSGKDLPTGRPQRIFRRDRAVELRAEGKSFRAIAKELGVPLGTVVRAIRSAQQGVPKAVS